MTCENVGSADSDIAGLGTIIGFGTQAGLSLLLSCYSLLLSCSTESRYVPDGLFDLERLPFQRAAVYNLLERFSEVAIFNALGLLIAGLVQHKSITFYHIFILTCTVNFIIIALYGNLYAIADPATTKGYIRKFYFILLLVIYLVFAVIYGEKLSHWDDQVEGRCYHSRWKTHPSRDISFLALTCGWPIVAMSFFTFTQWTSEARYRYRHGSDESEPTPRRLDVKPLRVLVLIVAVFQYSLELFLVIQARTLNEGSLSGDSENGWSFGQSLAVILACASATACIQEYDNYLQALPQHI